MAEHAVEVVSVIEETALDRTYVLALRPGAPPLRWEPGQHVWITDPARDPARPRAYSISNAPGPEGRLEVTVRAGSAEDIRRFAFRVGQALVAKSPEGRFTLSHGPGERLLLCAAGSGVTPFRAYVQHLHAHPERPRVVLVHCDRAPSRLLFRRELERHAGEGWLTYLPRVTGTGHGEPWDGATGRLDGDAVAKLLEAPAETVVHACGPRDFVDLVLETAHARGVPRARLRREGA